MTRKNNTCSACLRLQQRVEDEAVLGSKTLECFAGLSESAVPVRVGTLVLGYLQTGQVFFRAPSRRQFTNVVRCLPGGNQAADREDLRAAYFRTRIVTKTHYDAILRLLVIFAEHLATVSNQMLISQATAESPMIKKVRAFITLHQSEALCHRDLARVVNLSAFYFCKVFKKATGLTFTEYLARERIESAKQMLLNAHTRVSEAAYAAGFQSLSQFNRVFHRVAGEAPSQYRDRLHGTNAKAGSSVVYVPAA